ncbi:unnamed protein product [Rotaria sp. Silwood2]|nr:unnamed protein product [Rotaria sp. Silwood2]CAF4280738.1 unnamed protein product [Rotaria sp. Silwood2]
MTLSFAKIYFKHEYYFQHILIGNELSAAKFLYGKPLTKEEKDYYEECKEYYHLTHQPLISIADEVLDNSSRIPSSSIKIGIDVDYKKFDLHGFLNQFCDVADLNINDIAMKQIQVGSAILEAEIFNKFEADDKKICLKMFVHKITDKLKEQFGIMKIFLMFMGPIKSFFKMQKRRAEIQLNPNYNRIYAIGHDYWTGANNDGRDRGNKPYYCPVGWQRWSFYVTDNFDKKFKGWCIGYHGTKFAHGLSILLSGLKPAEIDQHGAGIYATPSVNYAAHPRYSEVKLIESSTRKKFFKSGKYVQFVLECRVHPSNIVKEDKETLNAVNTTIDPNINNAYIEWVINSHGKSIVDFNDPDSSIICTGILTRVTDEHPGLLPESEWWYKSHLCSPPNPKCCMLGISRDILVKQKQHGNTCKILFSD